MKTFLLREKQSIYMSNKIEVQFNLQFQPSIELCLHQLISWTSAVSRINLMQISKQVTKHKFEHYTTPLHMNLYSLASAISFIE